MEKVVLKFRRIEVARIDTRENVMHMLFYFDENGNPMKHSKNYSLEQDVDDFVNTLIHEVKTKAHERHAVVVDDDDFLSYHLNVLIDEAEPGLSKDKIANAIRRFKDKVRSFRAIRKSDGYMEQYQSLIGLKASVE
ncbi:MAG: hypothetical protein PHO02_01800 [Candidatus Nanoarchaeia archaeon]|nr:hypothetical protein [Candidatus Nanoarchaeia archaeon]